VLTTTGSEDVVAASGLGVAYDSNTGRFVAWQSGADVHVLDLESATFTRVAARSEGPSPPAVNGTFGRFRYSESSNVFVVVSSVDEDVYLYRLTAR
jgi:hypothetical protein